MTKNERLDYLGDGVYALWTPNGIELRANDHEAPTAIIWLDNNVFEALIRFKDRMEGKA
jgi:hypothetical protein